MKIKIDTRLLWLDVWPGDRWSVSIGCWPRWYEHNFHLMPACPSCEGDGGYTDVICPEIGGPYYQCEHCNGEGQIGWFGPLWYRVMDWLWTGRTGDLLIAYHYWVWKPADQYESMLERARWEKRQEQRT